MSNMRRLTSLAMMLLKILVTVGVAVWVLRNAALGRLDHILAQASPLWLALGGVAALLQLLVGAKRWQLVLHILGGAQVPYGPALRGLCRGTLFGQLLPSTFGSDAIRAVALVSDTSVAVAVRSVVCDRLLGLGALLLLVVVTLPLFAIFIDHGAVFLGLAIGSIAGFCLTGAMVIAATSLVRVPVLGRLAPYLGGDLRQVISSRAGVKPAALAILSHVLSIAMFAAMTHGVGSVAPLLVVALIVLPAILIASLPISLGGWGVREAVIASGFGMSAGSSAVGVIASILFGLSGPILSAAIELGYVLFGRRGNKSNKAVSGAI